MKVIYIKSCENCPNIRQGSKWEYCHLNSSQSHLLENYVIPEWCPLDEEEVE